jgi:hypothetical protein
MAKLEVGLPRHCGPLSFMVAAECTSREI